MEEEEDRMEVDDPNVHVPVEITHRIPIVRRPHGDSASANMPTYEGRRSNTRSLYGWAPGSDDEDEDIRRANES